MDSMDSSDRRNIWFMGIVFGTILILLCSLMYTMKTYYREKIEIFTSKGYAQRTVKGYEFPIWTKDKE